MSSLWNIRNGVRHRITALSPFALFMQRTKSKLISLINFFTFPAYWCYMGEIWMLLFRTDTAGNEFLKFQRLCSAGNCLNWKRASEWSYSKHYDPLALYNFFNALKHSSYWVLSWVLEWTISSFVRNRDKVLSWFSTYFHKFTLL